MANYLPVLLVSLTTNATPDDSAVSTLPRGQVDYLSHEWEEEDVWRSWRNMTKQKNEIVNGVRLENASWRTWWKQRNKLKTISPETLNWLKDSDVTWLYGPLHKAVEWTPLPKPKPVPDSVDPATPASAHDRLDLVRASTNSRNARPSKPILKHRSISELLTSELPATSPLFSPVESEEEDVQDELTTANTSANAVDRSIHLTKKQISLKAWGKRPSLSHTKSDTHITRWGASRVFRKDSPPRIDPPGFDLTQSDGYFLPASSTSSLSYQSSAGGSIQPSLSQDSTSSSNGVTSGGDSRGSHSHGQTQKKKHISFNTYVQQCIAIEKPKKNASGFFGASAREEAGWLGPKVAYYEDDGYEEDEEDSEEDGGIDTTASQWGSGDTGARGVKSDSDSPMDDDDDDDVIQIRPSLTSSTSSNLRNYSTKTRQTPRKTLRSQSKVSTASSSSSTSTSTTNSFSSGTNSNSTPGTGTSSPSGSLSPSRRTSSSGDSYRKASVTSSGSGRTPSFGSNSTHRPAGYRRGAPPLIRTTSDHSAHVTIAPIAPTFLKTGGAWSEGFGDEGASDDGLTGFTSAVGWGGDWSDKRGAKKSPGTEFGVSTEYPFGTGRGGKSFDIHSEDTQDSDGTPVELVYVPPFNYLMGLGEEDECGSEGFDGMTEGAEEREDTQEEESTNAVFHHPPLSSNTASVGYVGLSGSSEAQPIPISSQIHEYGGKNIPSVVVNPGSHGSTSTYRGTSARQIPPVQRENVDDDEDAYDFFRGADLGEDYYYARRGGRGYEHERDKDAIVSPKSLPSSRPFGMGSTGMHGSVGSDRNLNQAASETEKERRHSRGAGRTAGAPTGEERQSRSRSRSKSRTPSPAMIVSPTPNEPVTTPYLATTSGRKRSTSASLPSGPNSWTIANGTAHPQPSSSPSSDRLSPPSRGRQPQQSIQAQLQSSSSHSRGRSSTRTSSSSSWDRQGGSSLGSSPIGSLSPDGGVRSSSLNSVLGGASVLASGGRVDREREREKEREQERGRERRGRDRTSGKALGASETETIGRDEVATVSETESASATNSTSRKTVGTKSVSSMDASFISLSSNSSSNNSTVVGAGTPTVIPAGDTHGDEEEEMDVEMQHLRQAEEEQRRRVHPTPSNSPVTELRPIPSRVDSESSSNISTPKGRGSSSGSGGTTPTGVSTSSPVLSDITTAQTSYVAPASSLISPSSRTPSPAQTHRIPSGGISASQPSPSKLRPPPLIPSPPLPAKPSTSFTAVSSPMSPTATTPPALVTSTITPPVDTTIVGKAVDIVSNASAFFGWWGSREHSDSH